VEWSKAAAADCLSAAAHDVCAYADNGASRKMDRIRRNFMRPDMVAFGRCGSLSDSRRVTARNIRPY
jgi:hypothetical protein